MTIISLATGEKLHALPGGSTVALGFFDGVHIGHRAILDAAVKEASIRGASSAVWMIGSDSRVPFKGRRGFLTDEAEKLRAIAHCGIDYAVISDFGSIRELSGEQFVRVVLAEKLGVSACVCGFNFRFGKDAAWGNDDLALFCRQLGIAQVTVPAVTFMGENVSSSRIRALIAEGELSLAAKMLGRPYSFRLPVLCGKMLGRHLGFPTANQIPPRNLVCPPKGVYAAEVELTDADGSVKLYPGCANIGSCPTVTKEVLDSFGTDVCAEGAAWGERWIIETYIEGFSGDLYGQTVKVSLLERIREEKHFPNINELTSQIRRDSKSAHLIYEAYKKTKEWS